MSDLDKNMVQEQFLSVIDDRFTQYAYMSLEDRALPDARDGLKPSQRRVLVAMNDLNLTPGASTQKSAKICGDTSGNYHPHGEGVVYPTMCRLVQPWAMRYPLILGQGNFGNIDGDNPAAMRYTEAKLSNFGSAMLGDLSKDVVPFEPNYNEQREEPTILPGLMPNLLANGCEGIAVGWATKILPHNLRELVDVVKAYIKNPKLSAKEVLEIMPGPDFPTGGKILSQQGVIEYYATGKGHVPCEGTYTIENLKGKSQIVVTELPYQMSPARFCMDVEKLVDENKLDGVQDLKNLSSKKTGIRVVIEISKTGNPHLVLNKLLTNTCLRRSISVNSTVLIDGKVVTDTPIVQLIATFVDHRRTVLTNKFKAELAAAEKRIHILNGLIGITDKIDAVIALIRQSDSPEEAEQGLIQKKFVETIEQAKAVLAITLRQLTKLESDKLIAERNQLQERGQWLNKVLNSAKELDKVIVQEQEKLVKTYGDNRRTSFALETIEITQEDLIPDQKLVVSLTGDGYVKKIPVKEYRVQSRGGIGVKNINKNADPENIIEVFELHSKDYVFFFTNQGLVYQRRAFEIPQSSKTGKGLHLSNLLDLSSGEHVTNMVSIKDVEQKGYLVIVTKNGYIKKTSISEYNTNRKSGIRGVKLNADDEVAFAFLSTGKKDVLIVTEKGNCVRYSQDLIPVQGRGTRGTTALKLEKGDRVVEVMSVDKKFVPDIMVVTVGGYGKKTSSQEYRSLGSRNVKGYAVMSRKGIEKHGKLAGACCVSSEDTILVMTSSGKCIRLGVKGIRNTSRTTSGVKVVKLDGLDSVVKIAKLTSEEQ